MIGKTISHYRILEKLGEGGMGIVYKARDLKLDRVVALKFLPPHVSADEDEKKRFIHEAKAASRLDHTNICTVYEINETENGQLFIAMGYYEGETLKKKIEKGSLPIREALNIAVQIAKGLEKAHKKGIVHRDIKPANIMLTGEGDIKILDFGLAKLSGQTKLTKSGTTLGTVAYMSPEQTTGEAVDHRSDIWSLGVMLYEMLAGENPFKGDYEQAVVYSIMNEDPEFITKVRGEVPLQIEQILEKALVKNPDKRFQTMETMLGELQDADEELKRGLSRKSPIFKLGRKQRKKVYRALAISFVVIIMFGIYFWQLQVAEAKPVSIILLPLESYTDDAEQEWFSDGMTGALITNLAKIGGLRVMSRATAMRYKGTNKSPQEIAAELGVDYLVEGDVAMIDDQVKVSARLVDAIKDGIIWAGDYERQFSNILGLQGEIAQTIAGKIRVKLSPQEQNRLVDTRQVNPETYTAYLKGTYFLNQLTDDGVDKGLALLQEAVEKDPTEPLAYAALALGYSLISSHSADPPPDAAERAKAAVFKALELDETLAEAHLALAETRLYNDWDWEGAEQAFKRAIELNPSLARAHAHYAWLHSLFERQEEVIAEASLAKQLDPLTPIWNAWLADLHYWTAGEYDIAIDEAMKTLELAPGLHWPFFTLGTCYAGKGMYEEAIEAHKKAFAANPRWKWALGRTYAMAGRTDEAIKIIVELEEKSGPANSWGLAAIYAALGKNDEALKWMEVAYEGHHSWTPWFNGIFFETLFHEPRYQDLMRRLNLPIGD